MSGMIVEARAQVRIAPRVRSRRALATFFISLGSMNGPFLTDLLMSYLLDYLIEILRVLPIIARIADGE